MKKPFRILLPIVCSVPVLLGCSTPADKPVSPDMAMRIEPTQRVRHSASYAHDYYQLGRFYQGQNRLEKAAEAYSKALEVHSDYVDAQNALGTIYSRQEKYDEAVAIFTSILRTKPQIAKVYNNLGYTYFLQGKHVDAIAAFEKAIKLEPNNPRTHNNLVATYRKAGDEDSARIALARAAELQSPKPAAAETPTSNAIATRETKPPAQITSIGTPKVVNLQPQIDRSFTLNANGVTTVGAVTAPANITAAASTAGVSTQVVSTEPRIVNLYAQTDTSYTLQPNGNASIVAGTAPQMLALTPTRFFESAPIATLIPEANGLNDSSMTLAAATATAEKNEQDIPLPTTPAATIPSIPQPEPKIEKTLGESEPSTELSAIPLQPHFHLEIANGNGIIGLARKTRAILVQQGLPIARLTNFKPYQQKQTVIYYRAGYHDQALALSQKLARKPVLRQDESLRNDTDIKLILGKDVATGVALFGIDEPPAPLTMNNKHGAGIDG